MFTLVALTLDAGYRVSQHRDFNEAVQAYNQVMSCTMGTTIGVIYDPFGTAVFKQW